MAGKGLKFGADSMEGADIRMASNKEVTLDARWLLGDDPPRSSWGGLWGGTVFCLAIVCGCVWSWPQLSRWWLQRQLAHELQTTEDPARTASTLLALEQMMPYSALDVLKGLQSPHSESNQLAYQILDKYLQRLEALPIPNRRAIVQGLATALDQSAVQTQESSRELTAKLATRLLNTCRQDEHESLQRSGERLETLLANLESSPIQSSRETAPAKIASIGDRSPPTLVRSLSDSATSTNSGFTPTATGIGASLVDTPNAQEMSGSSPYVSPTYEVRVVVSPSERLPQVAASSNLRPTTTIQAVDAPIHETAYSIPTSEGARRSNPLRDPSVMQSQQDAMAESDIANSNETQNAYIDPSQNEIDQDTIDSQAIVAPPSVNKPAESPAIEGLANANTGQLVRLLASVQPRIANAAFAELERKGLQRDELELAVELARGSTRQRTEAMQRLVQSGKRNPIPWLVWMAEDGDEEVRKYAVAALGSLNDEIAAAELRVLLKRERDSTVRDQIQRVLMAFGSSNTGLRR